MEHEECKVSIIMSVLNMEKKKDILSIAIKSILNQTYTNFEFIICDDGSTDNTYQILKEFFDNDKRIKLIKNKQNKGLAYSLNKCIAVSKGIYIARMDGDDISKKDRLYQQIAFLEMNPQYDFVGCSIDLLIEDQIKGKTVFKKNPQKRDLLWGPAFAHPTIIIKKAALDKVGGYTVASYTFRAQDYDLYMKLYAHNFRGYNMPPSLFIYRVSKKKNYLKLNYRLNEMKLRYNGYKRMNCLFRGFPYIFKPIISWIMPVCMVSFCKKLIGR